MNQSQMNVNLKRACQYMDMRILEDLLPLQINMHDKIDKQKIKHPPMLELKLLFWKEKHAHLRIKFRPEFY